jgi:hypothetical protein
MKIKTEHYEAIKASIHKAAIAEHRAFLKSPANPRPAKDLEKRLRWDLLHCFKGAAWVCSELYPYLNDTHIDTALRSVVSELEAA